MSDTLPSRGTISWLFGKKSTTSSKQEPPVTLGSAASVPALAVSVTRTEPSKFVEKVLVTGSLVPREEILVGPEVEGLRVIEVLADEGDRVSKGQTLARLVTDTLEAQLAQNKASLARADAAIEQAKSSIASAEAKLVEAQNAYDRAVPLNKTGTLADSSMDQRESARRTAVASLASARDGLRVAEADKAQIEAQGREIAWRRARTEVRSPADGIVSRRNARIGAYASGVADPMFRIIAKGEIELDAEVPEAKLSRLKEGQTARIEVAGTAPVEGKLRIVSPEVDRTSRLGRVRIFIGDRPDLHIGSFARAKIKTREGTGLAVPQSAVLYGPQGAVVQVISGGKIATRSVKLGLSQGALIEVMEGLAQGDEVVVKSGTFLRDGDAARPVPIDVRRLSEAG
ncbi:MAG: efflux RND transporter periplasmic adaptor subunit [Proteobacteria bacterium]|nr:efflux RND transporter periplasmic adaptor subunit [Pseudomonadota bacterium]